MKKYVKKNKNNNTMSKKYKLHIYYYYGLKYICRYIYIFWFYKMIKNKLYKKFFQCRYRLID